MGKIELFFSKLNRQYLGGLFFMFLYIIGALQEKPESMFFMAIGIILFELGYLSDKLGKIQENTTKGSEEVVK